jgi:hypothetical protein
MSYSSYPNSAFLIEATYPVLKKLDLLPPAFTKDNFQEYLDNLYSSGETLLECKDGGFEIIYGSNEVKGDVETGKYYLCADHEDLYNMESNSFHKYLLEQGIMPQWSHWVEFG